MFSFLNKQSNESQKLISFELPIEYATDKHELPKSIIEDLELVNVRDSSATKPLYNYLLSPQTAYGEKLMPQWSKYFTTCPKYLKETKQIVAEYKDISLETDKIEVFDSKWREIKSDPAFDSKYFYVDVKPLAFLNKYPLILQGLSLYNFGAPFLSLLAPVFMFILPFFLLKATGTGISLTTYRTILMEQLKRQAFWRLFSQEGGSIQHKMYLLFSVVMYVFNIYQNIVMCIKFYKNFNYIFDFFHKASTYMEYISREMKKFADYCRPTNVYESFNTTTNAIYKTITNHCEKLMRLQPFTFSLTKFGYIGQVMHTFYEFNHNETLKSAIEYSLDYFGYLDTIKGIQHNLEAGHVNFGAVKSTCKNPRIRGVYYPNLAGSQQCIKNDVILDKNFVISGPNASGKTTLLKTILVNIIFTQQAGCGFYKSCTIRPYHRLHCYLNIPDTSGRDSLFQAEARRCKEIVDLIHTDISLNHFCIFDELYSGTNPYEAVASAFSYLAYLAKYKNVNIMITTHFLNLCELLERKEKYVPIQMETDVIGTDAVYKYKIKKGISQVRCGIRVLRQLNYPQEILDKVAEFSFN
jgi:DNA mismatch repair ATPase MutS